MNPRPASRPSRLPLGLLFVLAAAVPAPARPAPDAPSPGPANAGQGPSGRAERGAGREGAPAGLEEARVSRRVLHLSGGGVVRGVTRRVAGIWEIREGSGWRALPAGAVVRAVPERALIAEMRRRAGALENGDAAMERVALAEWMAREGLLAEAAAQLDRVLSADPDQPEALALLERHLFYRVPKFDPADPRGSREAIVRFAENAPPTARELAIAELGRSTDRDALRAELAGALRSSIVVRRAFAAQALGRLFPGEQVRALLVHAVLDASEEVRRRAAQALAAPGEPAVIVPVVRALESENPRVRVQAAEALGEMGFTAAVEPLIASLAAARTTAQAGGLSRVPHSYIFVGRQFAYIQDFDVEVAQFQAVADPQVNTLVEGKVLDVGVHSVAEYGFAYQSQVIRTALGKLTGENPGYTARAWLDWWEQHRETWRAADLSSPQAGEPRTTAR